MILLTGCRQGQISQLLDDGQFARPRRCCAGTSTGWGGSGLRRAPAQPRYRRYPPGGAPGRSWPSTPGCGTSRPAMSITTFPSGTGCNDVLVAIRRHATLDGCHRERRPNDQFYLRSAEEMAERFAAYPEAIANTRLISERCAAFNLGTGSRTTASPITRPDRADAGRCAPPRSAPMRSTSATSRRSIETAEARLDEELRMITHHKLSGFFLLYRDLLEMAREVASGGPRRWARPQAATCRRGGDGDHRSARSSAT